MRIPISVVMGPLLAAGLQAGCAARQACNWSCTADAYDEAERDASESGPDSPRSARALDARRSAERALWVGCVPTVDALTGAVRGGNPVERRRAVIVAEARGYDAPEFLASILASYRDEDDALARTRMLRVLEQARQSSLDATASADFEVLRTESTPRVMAAAIGVGKRLAEETTVPLLTDYAVRGPRWVSIAAYGAAHELGLAEKVRAELERRKAREALDLISQWEKTRGPGGPARE